MGEAKCDVVSCGVTLATNAILASGHFEVRVATSDIILDKTTSSMFFTANEQFWRKKMMGASYDVTVLFESKIRL